MKKAIAAFFSTRRARLGTLSGSGVLLLAAGLTLLNLLSQRFFVRFDWSAGDRYSLSPSSRKTVRNLPDPLILKAYISGGLPQPYEAQARYTADLLAEYRAAGRGRVKVEVLDPEGSEKVKDDARRAGVTPARFTQVASDQFQMREGFLGVAMFYQDKQEVLPFIKDAGSLEYEITSRVRKMARTSKKTLGLVTGHGETPFDPERSALAARLFDAFTVKNVELSTRTPAVDALFIVNPLGEIPPAQLDALDAAVASGTPAAVFLSRKRVDLQRFGIYPFQTGLDDFLAHYGLRVEEDFVLDAQCQQVQMQSQQGGFSTVNILSYPAFIISRPSDGHPVSRGLDALAFPFAHPLTPRPGGGLTVTPLAQSSEHSWVPPGLESLDPYSIRRPGPQDSPGPFILAAAVEGSTTSFRDPSRTAHVRLVVVGTGFFADEALPLSAANADFMTNAAEWLMRDEDFSAIPSRGPAFRPLRPWPAPLRAAAKLAGFFLIPGGVVFWGFARWRGRRRRRPEIQREWEAAARGA